MRVTRGGRGCSGAQWWGACISPLTLARPARQSSRSPGGSGLAAQQGVASFATAASALAGAADPEAPSLGPGKERQERPGEVVRLPATLVLQPDDLVALHPRLLENRLELSGNVMSKW